MRAYRVILGVVFWIILSLVLVAAGFWVYAIVTGGKNFRVGVPVVIERGALVGPKPMPACRRIRTCVCLSVPADSPT